MHLTICSISTKAALGIPERDFGIPSVLQINDSGQCDKDVPESLDGLLFFSQIQFSGEIEPKSGKAGLELIPGCVFYNGLNEGFLQSFAHFKNHPMLHVFSAIYMQKDTVLEVSEIQLRVRSGFITVMKALSKDSDVGEFEINQFGIGEEIGISEVGLVTTRNGREKNGL